MPRPTTRTGLADWLASGFGGMDFGVSPDGGSTSRSERLRREGEGGGAAG